MALKRRLMLQELIGKVMIRTPQSVANLQQGLKTSTSQPQTAAGLAQALNLQGGTRQVKYFTILTIAVMSDNLVIMNTKMI